MEEFIVRETGKFDALTATAPFLAVAEFTVLVMTPDDVTV